MPESPADARSRSFSVYIVRCSDGSLYTGIATDVSRRIAQHRSGRGGARYLRGRTPLELAAEWSVGDRSLASRVEHYIKRMSKAEKESLLAEPADVTVLLARFGRYAEGCRENAC